MRYAEFQSLYGRSDPRSVLAFQQPYTEVLPHIVVQAEELAAPLTLFDAVTTQQPFPQVFAKCFDAGEWLVVKDASQVDYVEWRQVALKLASVLPDARFRLRGHFRLFVFLLEYHQFTHIVPPLLAQFAIVVDAFGNVQTRTEMSPIFSGPTSVLGGGDFVALVSTVQDRPNERENDRASPYAMFRTTRQRTVQLDEQRTAATDPEYIDEVLCSLRDELFQQQANLVGAIEAAVDERLEALLEESKRQAAYNDGNFAESEASRAAKDPVAERERLMVEVVKEFSEQYEWIYSRVLEWVVEQCPDADLSALPTIEAAEITTDGIAWQTQEETCSTGIWVGTEVLVKSQRRSHAAEVNEALKHAFSNEAARHFKLRHPHVLAVYGLCDGSLVLERGPGTLEQALIRARYVNQHWSVRKLLQVAQQVLQGMTYLSKLIVHRDIACRSIIEVNEKLFKIGQFGCAIPLKHSPSEAKSGRIPVRWTAPEGIVGEFSPASDIWSFGILLWEASQYATALPYGEETFAGNVIVRKQKLACPPECSPKLFEQIIEPCWAADPQSRPTASRLLTLVSHALGFWPAADLDALLPFPADNIGFEAFNEQIAREKKSSVR